MKLKAKGFKLLKGSTVESITENGSSKNVVNKYIKSKSKTVTKDTEVTAKEGKHFTGIMISNGALSISKELLIN